LLLDFRERIALALATALLLAWLQRRQEAGVPALTPARLQPLLAHLGTHSYALFLVHFPILLLINALFERHELGDGWPGLMAMLAAWGLSNLAAVSFYRWIEAPAGRLRLGALLARLLPRTLRA
jgi:peptidoglycan/LPS O-acetylase OafA/YrhL